MINDSYNRWIFNVKRINMATYKVLSFQNETKYFVKYIENCQKCLNTNSNIFQKLPETPITFQKCFEKIFRIRNC